MINEHIKTELLQLLQNSQAWHYRIVPFKDANNVIFFYSDDNKDRNEIELLLGRKISIEVVDTSVIDHLLHKNYRKSENQQLDNELRRLEFGPDFLNNIIAEAKQTNSSDIHIEALEEKCRIRYRIDGKLIERIIIKKEDYPELINKVKILSNLDIAEKRLPQDGRISFNYNNEKFDLRISILPTMYGEKVVMRILGSDAKHIILKEIGFNENEYQSYLKGIQKPHGIILISGPTGSGKTTTLYASLNYLNKPAHNILTIEDPIEYTLEGINQVQLKEKIGLNFPKALRTFLRQDPDIIMVGEIRDKETAEMAVRASLTGHLVLSTIHTNSSTGTISRLIDMGIPEFLVADTLNLSVSQRLLRLLCDDCKEETIIVKEDLPNKYKRIDIQKSYKAKGCQSCHFSGYKNRKPVFEILLVNEDIKNAIKNKNITYIGEQNQFKSIGENCFDLFLEGKTSLEEIYPFLLTN